MCKTKAEGGPCYGHTRPVYDQERNRRADKDGAVGGAGYEDAVDRLGESLKGYQYLTERSAELRAGASADGDVSAVLDSAVVRFADKHQEALDKQARSQARARAREVARVPRPRRPLTGDGLVGGGVPSVKPKPEAVFATDFAEALRTGNPLEQSAHASVNHPGATDETPLARALRTGERDGDGTHRAPRHRQVSESPLATALRNGDTNLNTNTSTNSDAPIDEPVTIDGITVTRGQAPFLQRWGNTPVVVTTKMHVQHSNGAGWSEYDLATDSYKPVNDSDATVGHSGLFAKDTGVLVVQNASTGEKAALRARRDTTTGHWHINEDVTV